METFDKAAAPAAGSDPVSRPELDRLKAQRETPEPVRALTPDGAAPVKAAEATRQEKRIGQIEAALQAESGQAKSSFAKAKARGKAREDFGHSR